MANLLVDAGPLVALIDRSDRHHEICKRVLGSLTESMSTVWLAFTEAMYLLSSSAQAQRALWDLAAAGAVQFSVIDESDCPRMRELMWKFRDLPMDLADAALVRVAERERIRRIFTIDRRDFELYRPHRIGRFDILP